MSGAVSVALAKPSVEEASAMFGAAPVDTSGEPFFTLVKIDADGNVDPVFNPQRPIHWVEVNDTHVAVSGRFTDVAVLVEDGETPKSIDCSLVTFPRTATGEAVTCISRGVGFPNSDPLQTEDVPLDYPGFTAEGATVYFTELQQENPTTGTTRMWKWDGGSAVVELMLQLSLPLALAQPFALDGGAHVCAVSLASGHPSGEEDLYCSPLSAPAWADVAGDSNGSPSRGLVLGTNLVMGYARVSLVDGTVVTAEEPMPSGRNHTILVGDTAWGLSVGLGGSGGDLVRVTSTGSTTIDASVDWERIAGAGNSAYVYGSSQLRRLDFATGVLDPTNHLGSTTLLQVTDMSLSTDDNIRLDGTTSTGIPAIVLVNTSSGEITVTQEDVPRFQNVTPLE